VAAEQEASRQREQALQRFDVRGHVPVGRRDDDGPLADDVIAGEEPLPRRLVEAAMPGFVTRRVHDTQRSSLEADLVVVVVNPVGLDAGVTLRLACIPRRAPNSSRSSMAPPR